MNRRAFIGLAGCALARPFIAVAQRASRSARIGYLALRSPMSADDAFLKGLVELGWVEGQNIVIERRFAAGSVDRLKDSAAELVRLRVDVIVAAASAPTQVAKEATASIPIVFANAGDPVGQGLVQSLSRPGGNVTGIAFDAGSDITAKQAQLLIEIVPKASRLAVLWNPTTAFLHSYWGALKTAAPKLRVSLQSLEVRDPGEFERAFDSMKRERADGLIVLSDTFATFHRARIAELAAKHRLPTVYGHSQYIEAGGLMSYGPSLADGYRRAASHVDKILKGTRPADLPVEQPAKFELVINLKAAKAIGLAVPQKLLARSDEVIE
ncbi:MAG TPA: ABC transporter substrate-binding protein [Burkholderiales bacterium]|nr:ABC transporter substrate-binding protein [Burkholderiales bacterium]